MAQTVLITLTIAGSDTGPFDLYSNSDAYGTPFETGVSKVDLQSGYVSILVPDSATIIRVQSNSVLCQNYIDLNINTGTTTTTSSTSTTSTSTSTTTSTTTTPPDPLTANLTFQSYSSGDFTFNLSSAIYSTNTVISMVDVDGSTSGSCVSFEESDTLSSSITILAGSTSGIGSGVTPLTCSSIRYKRVNSIIVNGVTKSNGQTIVIGGTTVTIVIGSGCSIYNC